MKKVRVTNILNHALDIVEFIFSDKSCQNLYMIVLHISKIKFIDCRRITYPTLFESNAQA